MKKILLTLALLVLTLVSACTAAATPEKPKPTATPGPALYRVTKSTGLYPSTNMDTEPIDTLDVGTLLKPANNAKFYDCDVVVDNGEEFPQCHVEVVKTGRTGWVLQKWIERVEP
jgi:hypothetical protein